MMVGSSDYTREKFKRLEYILRVEAMAWRGVMERKPWTDNLFTYIDPFAGPGLYDQSDSKELVGQRGSPLLALDLLRPLFTPDRVACNGQPLGIRYIVSDPRESDRLNQSLEYAGHGGFRARSDSCETLLKICVDDWAMLNGSLRQPVGMAFFDPNGIPPWDSIARFAGQKRFQRIDLLININSIAIKRARNYAGYSDKRMSSEHLNVIGKRYVYLWQPWWTDAHQFTLAFLTNWDKFPEFPKLRFHRIDTPEGRSIAQRMDLTQRERDILDSSNRPFLPGMHTDDEAKDS
jgi:three-Cys-motif partner protein